MFIGTAYILSILKSETNMKTITHSDKEKLLRLRSNEHDNFHSNGSHACLEIARFGRQRQLQHGAAHPIKAG